MTGSVTGAIIMKLCLTKLYIREEPGRVGKGIFFGFLPYTYWVFLITSNFLAWLGITIHVKKLEASHNMQ